MIKGLLKSEDQASVFIGSLVLLFALIAFSSLHKKYSEIEEIKSPSFKTINHYLKKDSLNSIKASKTSIGKALKGLTGKPEKWENNPIKAFYLSEETAEELNSGYSDKLNNISNLEENAINSAKEAQKTAANENFNDSNLNQIARSKIETWREIRSERDTIEKKASQTGYNRLPGLILLFLVLGIIFGLGNYMLGQSFVAFTKGFFFIFILATVAYWLAGNSSVKNLGIGYAVWAIAIGMLISNTIGVPGWVKEAVRTEYFIKTALVILGAEILFGKILAIGLPGIFVAWVVTPVVLISTYWFGQKILKIGSKTLNITISADMSVCGVSAAVAVAAACKAKKEELTLAIGLSMVFTAIMMVVLPTIIKALGMPEVLGGAWIGGTIDSTGAVAAAGAWLGDKALNVAATIKMIQNILIGVVAFFVAIFFAQKEQTQQKTGITEIWKRFPKFILGFIGASVVFSLIHSILGDQLAYTLIEEGAISAFTKNIRGWLFCIAFVSIGLATNFKELSKYFKGGKPLILYICGQVLNLGLTLLMAWIMFYLIFHEITASL